MRIILLIERFFKRFSRLLYFAFMYGVVVDGPFSSFRWASLPFSPVDDGSAEYEQSGQDYETHIGPSGKPYLKGTYKAGYVKMDCNMDSPEYKAFIAKKDGNFYAGTATLPDGGVLSINGAIEGEHTNAGGKVTVTIKGKVRLQ